MSLRAVALVSFAVLTLAWFLGVRGPYPDPGHDPSGLEMLAILVFVFLLGFVLVVTFIAALVRDWTWTRRWAALFGVLFGSCLLGIALSELEMYQWDRPAIREVKGFARELEAYRARNGAYPPTLRALGGHPPSPELEVTVAYSYFDYSARDGHFVIGFAGPSRWYRWLTDDGWVSEEPDFMYPLSSWAHGSNY